MRRNIAIAKIGGSALALALGLPAEHAVVDVERAFDVNDDVFRLKLVGPSLPEVPEGQPIPSVALGQYSEPHRGEQQPGEATYGDMIHDLLQQLDPDDAAAYRRVMAQIIRTAEQAIDDICKGADGDQPPAVNEQAPPPTQQPAESAESSTEA